MAQSINIHSIIDEVSELNDLLKVISECNGNIPSILYKLAQEKASAIAENISSLSGKQPETVVKPSAPEPAVETQQQTEELPPVQETEELIIAQSVQQTPEPEEPKIEENDILSVSIKYEPERIDKTEPTQSAPTNEETDILAETKQPQQPIPATTQSPVNTTPTDNCIGGQNGTRLLDDILKQRIASKDIRKAISLNDRFRFKRDLFGGSDEAMCKTIEILNTMHSAKEALNYLEKNFQWNFEDETTNDFITILEKRFSL